MGLRQVLVVGSFSLAQVWNGVEPEAIDAQVEPVPHDPIIAHENARIVEVEVGLVREEAVPVIALRLGIPGPVRLLGIGEDDARPRIFLVGVAPDVTFARVGDRCFSVRARTRGVGPKYG